MHIQITAMETVYITKYQAQYKFFSKCKGTDILYQPRRLLLLRPCIDSTPYRYRGSIRNKHRIATQSSTSRFRSQLRKHYRQSKVNFGFPSKAIDTCSEHLTYQPGGNLTLINGNLTSSCLGDDPGDGTGLGRWSGLTLRGKDTFTLTIITAYHTCGGNIRTSPLGSTYSREYNYYRDRGHKTPNPRRLFLQDLETKIKQLQQQGRLILLMLDANADDTDPHFQATIHSCDLHDLHSP